MSDNAVTCALDFFPVGETATITIVANLGCSVADGTQITNTAMIIPSGDDPNLANNTAQAVIKALNPPPVIGNVSVSKPVIQPSPNHVLVTETMDYSVTDNCGPITSALSVESNEPINGLGDGDRSPDWVILDAHHVQLRAERSGAGTGRIYTITVEAADSAGNLSTKTVTVTVPLSQKNK